MPKRHSEGDELQAGAGLPVVPLPIFRRPAQDQLGRFLSAAVEDASPTACTAHPYASSDCW
jgi:hypothetical protein